MSLTLPLIAEFDQECAITQRLLERVPESKFGWKPHPKSMSLGELAWHLATAPSFLVGVTREPSFDFATAQAPPPVPKTAAAIVEAHVKGQGKVREFLGAISDARALETFKVTKGSKTLMNLPRIAFIRAIGLNHIYHHRGQLSVYLRLLEVPVPSIYGPSADENPFA